MNPSPENNEPGKADRSQVARDNWQANREKIMGALNEKRAHNSIRALRLALPNSEGSRGMNQKEFALAVGLTASQQSKVSNWESGLIPPTQRIEAMQQLAAQHGIDWRYE